MTGVIVDLAGWVGAVALLGAYALVSTGRLHGRGLSFQLLNLVGAIGLLANGTWHGAWPSAALNAVWLVVGLVALTRLRPGRPVAREMTRNRTPVGQSPDSAAEQPGRHNSFHRQEKT